MLAKNKGVGRRAWSILRLVLLWARKGGVFRRRLVVDLHLFGRSGGRGRDRIRSMERELSFEKTPMVHVKMHRPHSLRFVMPHLPCINPRTDYDYDFDLDREDCCGDEGYAGYNGAGRICRVESNLEEGPTPRALREVEAAEGIDFKAEEFIAKFYQQMKLQRQISNLGYYETRDQSNS